MAKGFGKPANISTRDATKFMQTLMQCIAKPKDDENQAKESIYRFLQKNLDKLNESLLEALPLIFTKLIANKSSETRQNAIELFANFGSLLAQFPFGDRSLNLELSITSLQLSLKLLDRSDFPKNWATIQLNLGAAYGDRVCGNKADNLEKAITACKLALQVFTFETFPKNWAIIQLNLGNIYGERIYDSKANNLEQSIAAYLLSLQFYDIDTFPEDWAKIQNNLGVTYQVRICGNQAENFEKAITYYELALQIYTRQVFPEKWAGIQNNLGNAYCERLHGDRAENLEKAIAFCELALQVRTYEAYPEEWAATQNNLGVVYRERIQGDRVDNLEKAIFACKLALQIRTHEDFPLAWAETQNNLALIYCDRIQGDKADNIEQAIAYYQKALQVHIREEFLEKWAVAQHNLANAYRYRIFGNQIKNIEQAILLHKQAAQVFTREVLPNKWAENQGNLAEAFAKRASLANDVADLDTAIDLFQEALEVAVPGSPDFINSQYRLGNALSRRYEHNKKPEDLEQALRAYQIALDAINPEHYDRSQIWQALPTTQSILGSRLVRDGQWQEGLQLLLNSVEQLRTGDDILAHANALFQTGYAHETLSDWENARLYYRDALRLYDRANDQLGIAQSRAGLGSVLVSQGSLQKGMAELEKAIEVYRQLQRLDRVAELENLYQVAQKAWERQASEVYA